MRLVHAFVRLTATCCVSTLMCGEQEEVKEELFLPPHSCCILGERLSSRQGCDRGAEGKKVNELLSERVCVWPSAGVERGTHKPREGRILGRALFS